MGVRASLFAALAAVACVGLVSSCTDARATCDPDGAWRLPSAPPGRVDNPAYTLDYATYASVQEFAEGSTLIARGHFVEQVTVSNQVDLFDGAHEVGDDPERVPAVLVWDFAVAETITGSVPAGETIQVLVWGSFDDRFAAFNTPARVGDADVVILGTDFPTATTMGSAYEIGSGFQAGLGILPVGCDGLLEIDPLATVPLSPSGEQHAPGTSIPDQLGLDDSETLLLD